MTMGFSLPRRAVLAGAVAGLLAATGAGCTSAGHGGSAAARPSASSHTLDRVHPDSAVDTATKRAACLAGTWTSTGMQVTAPGGLSEHGAAGVRMKIGKHGSVAIHFNGMAPVDFTSQNAGGSFVFGGDVTGHAVMPAPSASTGSWEAAPGSAFDYRTLTVTVRVTSPVDTTMGPLSISQLGSQFNGSGGSVASAPLGSGTWTCGGNTLVNHPPSGTPSDGTWTWTRTG